MKGAAELTVNNSASLHFGTGDWALAFVYKNSGFNSVTTTIFQKTDGSSPLLSLASSGPGAYTVTEGGSTASASVTFAPTFGYYIMRGPAMSLATSAGSSTGTTATGDVSNTGAPITLCDATTLSGTIEMAEVIAVKGTVSESIVRAFRCDPRQQSEERRRRGRARGGIAPGSSRAARVGTACRRGEPRVVRGIPLRARGAPFQRR